ncbi:MAG: low affinity iron permease family protein [Bdellovibrionia bacterium]
MKLRRRDSFRKFARRVSDMVGAPIAFVLALTVILLWIGSGPIFHFSDTWQLVINTATTIITFLMVFIIQNAQNRDARAFHLKLDELIKGVKGARTELVDLEELTDEELEAMQLEFRLLHEKLSHKLKTRKQKVRSS